MTIKQLELEIISLKAQIDVLTKLVSELSKPKVEYHYHYPAEQVISPPTYIPPNIVWEKFVTVTAPTSDNEWIANANHVCESKGLPSTVAGCDKHI